MSSAETPPESRENVNVKGGEREEAREKQERSNCAREEDHLLASVAVASRARSGHVHCGSGG